MFGRAAQLCAAHQRKFVSHLPRSGQHCVLRRFEVVNKDEDDEDNAGNSNFNKVV